MGGLNIVEVSEFEILHQYAHDFTMFDLVQGYVKHRKADFLLYEDVRSSEPIIRITNLKVDQFEWTLPNFQRCFLCLSNFDNHEDYFPDRKAKYSTSDWQVRPRKLPAV